jgi:hypothetical protein
VNSSIAPGLGPGASLTRPNERNAMNRFVLSVLLAIGLCAAIPDARAYYRGRSSTSYNSYTGGYAHTQSYHNPYTGGGGTSHSTYNPYTGTSRSGSTQYNPYTNTVHHSSQTSNPYTGRSAYQSGYYR